MYPAFLEHQLLALDGMRCSLVLLSNTALEGIFRFTGFESAGFDLVSPHSSPADLAENHPLRSRLPVLTLLVSQGSQYLRNQIDLRASRKIRDYGLDTPGDAVLVSY